MKKFTVTIVLAVFAYVLVSAQGCLPEGITFTTQEEIDNFQNNYPGCTEIEGDVTIGGDYINPSDITNLEGLSVVTSIGGYVVIHYTDIANLTGLENLTSIGGNFVITYTDITNLTGLGNLTSIGGSVFLSFNDVR